MSTGRDTACFDTACVFFEHLVVFFLFITVLFRTLLTFLGSEMIMGMNHWEWKEWD